jgi:carbonic anhydrase
MIKKAVCLSSILLASEVACDGLYNYNAQGSDWGLAYPTCTSGLQQSPIDLSDSVAVLSDKLMI